ncbi:MAG: bifunctional UDP-N-acetylglucosamine diphosphorylase/glucosamine-1-phosphate N-acetyltransferase GlmU [Bilophila sp.]
MSDFSLPEGMCALILAAGKGTRMHTRKPKVLHTILGEPLLGHVVGTLRSLFGDAIWTVIGHEADMVRAAFAKHPMRFIEQTEQRGTGHALMVALSELQAAGMKRVLVVNGDTPLITRATLERFIAETQGAAVAVATLTLPSPEAYGRIVRHNNELTAIVEAKDFNPAIHGTEPHEINAGVYALDLDVVARLIPRLQPSAASGELYITDLVGFAVHDKLCVRGIDCGDDPTLLGINNPAELSRSEELLRASIVHNLLETCVVMHAPESIRIGPFVTVEPGAELFGPCELYGHTTVAADACIESHCRIADSTIAAGAIVHSFSHLEEASVGMSCLVGPYARLRPGAVMEQASHVGNFVEMKKARLGVGAKANHLTYLGDAEVGAHANVGAGTITCNYDGVHKHKTVIGEHAFIGSNTSLVAPVTVGNEALIGAGSVITKNVPDNTLAVTRARQMNLAKR